MKGPSRSRFPPVDSWDERLSEIACPDLTPIVTHTENAWFAVRERGGWFTLEYHLAQVVVLPVIEDEEIVLVHVKRPVIGEVTRELPAGAVEIGESPEAGAARELAEEAGIEIRDLERFVPMPPLAVAPDRMPRLVYAFRVDLTRAEFRDRRNHDDEVERVESVAVADAVRLILTGGIFVAIPIAVISTYLLGETLGTAR